MPNDWKQLAEELREAMKDSTARVEVRIADIQRIFGISSTSVAAYYMTHLVEAGEIESVRRGLYKRYFLKG